MLGKTSRSHASDDVRDCFIRSKPTLKRFDTKGLTPLLLFTNLVLRDLLPIPYEWYDKVSLFWPVDDAKEAPLTLTTHFHSHERLCQIATKVCHSRILAGSVQILAAACQRILQSHWEEKLQDFTQHNFHVTQMRSNLAFSTEQRALTMWVMATTWFRQSQATTQENNCDSVKSLIWALMPRLHVWVKVRMEQAGSQWADSFVCCHSTDTEMPLHQAAKSHQSFWWSCSLSIERSMLFVCWEKACLAADSDSIITLFNHSVHWKADARIWSLNTPSVHEMEEDSFSAETEFTLGVIHRPGMSLLFFVIKSVIHGGDLQMKFPLRLICALFVFLSHGFKLSSVTSCWGSRAVKNYFFRNLAMNSLTTSCISHHRVKLTSVKFSNDAI